jgi:energy-coupling factor transport system ATP-binding protein
MLSGGQKQRLAIAGALAVGSECLILDEPTAMLDQKARLEVRSLMKDLLASGMSILLISHLPEELMLCNQVLVLHAGKCFKYDDPADLYRDSLYVELGLHPPFSAFAKGPV